MKVSNSWPQVPNVKNNDEDASSVWSYMDDISVLQDDVILQQYQACTPVAKAMLTPTLPAKVRFLLMYSFSLADRKNV